MVYNNCRIHSVQDGSFLSNPVAMKSLTEEGFSPFRLKIYENQISIKDINIRWENSPKKWNFLLFLPAKLPLIDDTQWGAGRKPRSHLSYFPIKCCPALSLWISSAQTFYCTAPTHVIPAVKLDRMFIDYFL